MDVFVYLWNTKIGTLRYNEEKKSSSFQYDKDFIKSGIELSPIVMPLSTIVFSFDNDRIPSNYGLPPLLRDSLPDVYGNKIINLYLKSLNREENSLSPSERLSYEGKRGMGALEYIPDTSAHLKDKNIDLDELVNISSKVLQERENFVSDDLLELINVSTSAGGARSKAVVQYNKTTKEFRSGQVDIHKGFDYYIIKFDDFSGKNKFTRIEYAYYLMARDCLIDINDSFLLKKNNLYHFLTKRFDRKVIDNKTYKIHTQTLAAMCHLDYDIPCQIGYEYIFDILNRLHISHKKEQMFRRMVFNVIASNFDDHVKNTSFVMNKQGIWDLSNAYDITFAYDSNNYWLNGHQMTINNKNSNITIDDILMVAEYARINKEKALEIVKDIQNVVFQFDKYAKEADLSNEDIEKIKKYFVSLL